MSFMLDTDICSAYLKNHPQVVARVMMHYGSLHVSAITVGELMVWTKRSSAPAGRRQGLEDFLSACHVRVVDRSVAERFGEIRAALMDQGRTVGPMDLLNAAVAMVDNLTVVTHNVSDYQSIPGLSIVDWMTP